MFLVLQAYLCNCDVSWDALNNLMSCHINAAYQVALPLAYQISLIGWGGHLLSVVPLCDSRSHAEIHVPVQPNRQVILVHLN